MSDDSLTTRILIEIRDEIRQTNARLDQTNGRLDQTNGRLEQLNQRVERGFEQTNERIDRVRSELKAEIAEVDIRTQTRLIELNATATKTYEMLRDQFDLRDRVENCEREIDELKKRVG